MNPFLIQNEELKWNKIKLYWSASKNRLIYSPDSGIVQERMTFAI